MNEQLKQRLVGAAVLLSLGVIFIPMILDGDRQTTMPMFGSNVQPVPDYQFEPLDIPLRELPPQREVADIVTEVEPEIDLTARKSTQKPAEKSAGQSTGRKAVKSEVEFEPLVAPKEKTSRKGDSDTGASETANEVKGADKGSSSKPVEPKSVASVAQKSSTKAPASSTTSTTDSTTPRAWAVQVGSFSSSENAIAYRDKLRKEGFTAFVERLKKDGKLIYRVRIGPVRSRDEAQSSLERFEQRMKKKGLVVGHPS